MAGRMFDAAVATLLPVERMPARGSPRLGQLCEIPGLRCWRVADFPMQWLYVAAADQLDVVRMLDDQQGIVALMTTSDWVGGMPSAGRDELCIQAPGPLLGSCAHQPQSKAFRSNGPWGEQSCQTRCRT